MLKSVKRPDGEVVSFEYDPLGRRISKRYKGTTTRWIWDGNVPLHEWTDEEKREGAGDENLITWLFEEGSFVPTAKIIGNKAYSIITDYLGTPTHAFDSKGDKIWERELDIYGKAREGDSSFIPFLYQGQYFDEETDLCYNRFRYYSPDTGSYISQDPIGLAGGNPTLYAYVKDSNDWIDVFGLDCQTVFNPKNNRFQDAKTGKFVSRKNIKDKITVYRVFGGDARAAGYSWSPVNPTTVDNYRYLAGLPSGGASGAINTADFMLKGQVNIGDIIKIREALPLDGNIGGLTEFIIDPKNVTITDILILNP